MKRTILEIQIDKKSLPIVDPTSERILRSRHQVSSQTAPSSSSTSINNTRGISLRRSSSNDTSSSSSSNGYNGNAVGYDTMPFRKPKVGYAIIVETPAQPPKKFHSCLTKSLDELLMSPADTSPRTTTSFALLRSLSNSHELEDESWLNSAFIDFVISQFAKHYRNTYFMSIDFAVLGLSSITPSNSESLTDISGTKINYRDTKKEIVFVLHKSIHWNLIRIVRHPKPVLELYEPMGKPSNRHGGLNFRQVPQKGNVHMSFVCSVGCVYLQFRLVLVPNSRLLLCQSIAVIEWLDMCCPLREGSSWLSVGLSAITNQQQVTNFDCGVACLLYAEKCGQQQVS